MNYKLYASSNESLERNKHCWNDSAL